MDWTGRLQVFHPEWFLTREQRLPGMLKESLPLTVTAVDSTKGESPVLIFFNGWLVRAAAAGQAHTHICDMDCDSGSTLHAWVCTNMPCASPVETSSSL